MAMTTMHRQRPCSVLRSMCAAQTAVGGSGLGCGWGALVYGLEGVGVRGRRGQWHRQAGAGVVGVGRVGKRYGAIPEQVGSVVCVAQLKHWREARWYAAQIKGYRIGWYGGVNYGVFIQKVV